MQFFRDIIQSLYGPDYFRTLPSRGMWYSIRYFALLVLCIALITAGYMAPSIITGVNRFVSDSTQTLLTKYPDKLQVQIAKGQVSTNVQEPFFLSVEKRASEDDLKNILVIDTKSPFSEERFASYSAYAWLSNNAVYISNGSDGGFSTQSLKEVSDITVNKQEIEKTIAAVKPYFGLLAPLMIVALCLVVFLVQFIAILYLWILSVVFRFIAQMFSISLGYENAFQLTLHAATIGLILDLLVQVLRPVLNIPQIPFMFTVVTFISFSMNVLMQKNLWNKNLVPVTAKSSSKAKKTVKKKK